VIGSLYRLTNVVTDFFAVCLQTIAGRLGRLLVLPHEASEGASALLTGKRCRAHEMAVLVCNQRGFEQEKGFHERCGLGGRKRLAALSAHTSN